MFMFICLYVIHELHYQKPLLMYLLRSRHELLIEQHIVIELIDLPGEGSSWSAAASALSEGNRSPLYVAKAALNLTRYFVLTLTRPLQTVSNL